MRRCLVLLAGLAACSRAEPAESGGGAALMRNLLRARAVEIVVRPGRAETVCWTAAKRIARERHVDCTVVSPVQRGDARAVRILVAGPDSDLGVAILRRMGLEPDPAAEPPSFRWRGTTFAEPTDALLAVVEDPERPGLPLTLLYANDESALLPYLETLEPGWRPSMRLHRRLDPRIEAPLSLAGWIDESRLVSRGLLRRQAVRGYVRHPGPEAGITVEASPRIPAEALARYLESVARARNATAAWADAGAVRAPVRLVLHDRPDALAACVGGATLSDWNPATGEVHALLAPDVPDDAGLASARALAQELLGPPASPWLGDGAAVLASGRYYGRELGEWVAWMRAGGLATSAGALVDPQATETTSPHLVLPLRAELFRFLLEGRGEGFVRSLWAGRAEMRIDPELEASFGAWLDDAASSRRAQFDARHAERRVALLRFPFLAAVGFEEPVLAAERGFGSERYLASLAQAQELGATGVSLSCFAVVERDPIGLPDASPGALARRALAPTCGDLRLFAGLCQARARGLATLLQPRLLTAPGGSLAGTGPQDGELGWRRFFDAYGRRILHFALLAELAGADGISLGGGLTASTTAAPGGFRAAAEEVAWRRAGWERVIAEARGAFSGSLAWAADSAIDARELAFTEGLDALACDLEADYDPHATSFHASPVLQMEVDFERQLLDLEQLARARGRPLLLTQAGFRSGFPEPGTEGGGRVGGGAGLQAIQFDVLATAVGKARERGTLRGAVLWRWSSDPDDPGANACDGLIRPGEARAAAERLLRIR